MSFEREVFSRTIRDDAGNIVPNAQITVYRAEGGLATIYTSLTGAAKSNPFTTGSSGVAEFYAEPGRYDVHVFKGGNVAILSDVDLSQKAHREDLDSAGIEQALSLRDDLASDDSEVKVGAFKAKNLSGLTDETVEYKIPTDFLTLRDALDSLGPLSVKGGTNRVDLILETGYVMSEGVSLIGGDYSHITIKSETPTVNIASDFQGVVATREDSISGGTTPSALLLDGATSPNWCILLSGENFRPEPLTFLNGCSVLRGGKLTGMRNGSFDYGFIEFTGTGVYCRRGTVYTNGMRVYRSGRHGYQITEGSQFSISTSNAEDCWWNNVEESTNGAVAISRGSSGSAQTVNASGSGATGFDIRRSFVHMQNAVANNCARTGLSYGRASYVMAQLSEFQNNGENGQNNISIRTDSGVLILHGSTVAASNGASGFWSGEGTDVNPFYNQVTSNGMIINRDAPSGEEIIEGNGGYCIRYASGIQICCNHNFELGSITAAGSGTFEAPYQTQEAAWDYPASFTNSLVTVQATPFIPGSPTALGRIVTLAMRGTQRTDRTPWLRAARMSGATSSDDAFVNITAIGRWFN